MTRFRLTLLAFAALALLAPSAARADWGDPPPAKDGAQPAAAPDAGTPVQPQPAEAPADKPEWQKYAFNLPYMSGDGYLRFADLASSGKPFIIVWWLSDCPVCHLQLPYVEQLQRMTEGSEINLQVVSINIDGEDGACQRYCKDKGISFNVLRDPRARRTDDTYKVRDLGTPVTYVFKAGGEYVTRLSGFTRGYPRKVLDLLDIPVPESANGGNVARDVDSF